MADRAPVTAALLVALRTLNFAVGDGVAPRPDPGEGLPDSPYFVLYSIVGGSFDGPQWYAPTADATLVYQLDAVGERRDQVETLMDKGRAIILGRTAGAFTTAITPTGFKVIDRSSDGGAGGIEREGLVFSSAERFTITVTPA